MSDFIHLLKLPASFLPLWLEVFILLTAASTNNDDKHGSRFIKYHFCIHLPSHYVVRNPPVKPSKYIPVPRKQADKMGFDEVSKSGEKMECAKMAFCFFLCA